jgi:hypothetical protein
MLKPFSNLENLNFTSELKNLRRIKQNSRSLCIVFIVRFNDCFKLHVELQAEVGGRKKITRTFSVCL